MTAWNAPADVGEVRSPRGLSAGSRFDPHRQLVGLMGTHCWRRSLTLQVARDTFLAR